MKRKREGFTSLECVISLFILMLITYTITYSMHNCINLLNKNENNLKMLSIAKESIEDERNIIKNSSSIEPSNKSNTIDEYFIETSISNTSFYKCYNLNLKISSKDNNMELNTYVTKK